MEASIIDTDFNKIVQSRRSVYPYQFEKGKRIPDEIVWQILENANRAPTHKLTEPWRFTVFTKGSLQNFAAMQSEVYSKFAGDSFKEKKLKNLLEYPLMASHVIAIGMKRSVDIKIPETEEILAMGCAIENIYLSTQAYGLAGYLSTGGITYLDEAKALFGLEAQDKLMGFFYLGYAANISNPLSKRRSLQEKVKWYD